MLNQNLLLTGDDSSAYLIQRSLRFRRSASGYLNRTPSSATSRTTWTYSTWVKRGQLGGYQNLLAAGGSANTSISFHSSSDSYGIDFAFWNGSGYSGRKLTSSLYRDCSAWYHIICVADTTNATVGNRMRIYVNGVQVTSFSVSTDPSQNFTGEINNTTTHWIGQSAGSDYLDGYLADTYFIDGQALTPSSFGETDAITGVWKPKRYAGTYGTNGFKLDFSDNSAATAAAIGKDSSGNGNNWTPNNISLSAGATYDSMLDVPTLTSASASNYATLNPLNNYASTIADGNLKVTTSDPSSSRTTFCTIGAPSGKWYWEVTIVAKSASYYPGIGVNTNLAANPANQSGGDSTGYMYLGDGQKFNNGSLTSYGATYAAGDVIGVALDMTAGTITFYKNNTSQGQAFSGITGTAVPCIVGNTNSVATINFGQQPFAYTPPTGFKALNTYNLPDSTILAGNKHFDVTTWTGTGSARSITNSGGMKPDFFWGKMRNSADKHYLFNSVVGVNKFLSSNLTDAETTDSTILSSFDSGGFSLGSSVDMNRSGGYNYVGFQWKGGGSAVSNTNGSITSQVSANASAGFSVVTYTGDRTSPGSSTVGHGLGVAPKVVITKRINGASDWIAQAPFYAQDYFLILNTTAAIQTSAASGAGTLPLPTSTTFGVTYYTGMNVNTQACVAFCFAEVAGYSKFGSYIGNGSSDGPFVHLGFKPKLVMIKRADSTGNWCLHDFARPIYNGASYELYPNLNYAEGTSSGPDKLSNGFKLRDTYADVNASGGTYIYMAFAENPFKNSLAR